MGRVVLVLGGARSGKSRFAEGLVQSNADRLVYIATSELIDEEMRERAKLHVAQRGDAWTTVETPLDVPGAISRHDGKRSFILVECITIWVNNLFYHHEDVNLHLDRLVGTLGACVGTVVLVSNEVGLGIVPDNALARQFRDEAGRANQTLAHIADDVYFIAAGLPLTLKKSKQGRRTARTKWSSRGRKV